MKNPQTKTTTNTPEYKTRLNDIVPNDFVALMVASVADVCSVFVFLKPKSVRRPMDILNDCITGRGGDTRRRGALSNDEKPLAPNLKGNALELNRNAISQFAEWTVVMTVGQERL
jgi:hypothetical protein